MGPMEPHWNLYNIFFFAQMRWGEPSTNFVTKGALGMDHVAPTIQTVGYGGYLLNDEITVAPTYFEKCHFMVEPTTIIIEPRWTHLKRAILTNNRITMAPWDGELCIFESSGFFFRLIHCLWVTCGIRTIVWGFRKWILCPLIIQQL